MTSDAQPADRSAQPSPALSTPTVSTRIGPAPPSRALGRRGAAALAIGLAVLLAIVGGSVWLAARNRAAADHLAQASRLRLLATDLSASLVDAETGQRGFLLTGQTPYLAPFIGAARRLPGEIAALQRAASRQPRTDADMAALRRLVPAKLDELQQTLRLAHAGDRAAALALVASGRGKGTMDAIRTVAARMTRREDRIVAGLVRGINARGNRLVAIDSIGIVLVLGIAVMVGFGLRRALAELRDAGAALVAANDRLGQANETLEQAVRERTADLTEANDEIQRFAYIVSHDLRAPLVNVMGFTSELETVNAVVGRYVAELAAQPGQTVPAPVADMVAEELPEAIGFIKSSTAKMDRLIGAILRLSREGRRVLVPERVAMGALLGDIAANLAHQAEERGAEVAVGYVPDLVIDRLAVEQVFGNLIENALKYLDPGRPGRIGIGGRRQGAYAVIEVRDNGRGIAPRDHERIFELFRRAGEQTVPGEGIGLAHVRALVRRLGGRIDCQSALGAGSTFRVVLPLAPIAEKGAVA